MRLSTVATNVKRVPPPSSWESVVYSTLNSYNDYNSSTMSLSDSLVHWSSTPAWINVTNLSLFSCDSNVPFLHTKWFIWSYTARSLHHRGTISQSNESYIKQWYIAKCSADYASYKWWNTKLSITIKCAINNNDNIDYIHMTFLLSSK